jgi:phosphoesterase RecJ-like protein
MSLNNVVAAIRERQSFVLTSHARPDGDAIGSQMALGLALEALGKTVRWVDHDPAPQPYRHFPAVDRIEVSPMFTGDVDAVIVMECSTIKRTEVGGLDTTTGPNGAVNRFVINIDHHGGNTMYGDVNWFDESACAVCEMTAEIIDALGVAWTKEIATHLYLGISTDTGSFRHANVTPRTFAIAGRIAALGVNPEAMARQIYDSFSIGRVRLTGEMLHAMELHHNQRVAILYFDDELLKKCGAATDDTDGLVNMPLAAKDVAASALIKGQPSGAFRVSLRSKGEVDVRAVAQKYGGGGHQNAAGCDMTGTLEEVKRALVEALK